MRRKRMLLFAPLLPIAGLVIMTALASPATSKPSFSDACSGCHGADASVSLSANLQSQTDTTATYAVSGSTANNGGEGWGVFNSGGTKVASGSGNGQFTVPRDGATYTVYWVDRTTSTNVGSTSTSVTAPPPATTTTTAAPTTSTTATPPSTTVTTAPPTTTSTTVTTPPPPATTTTTVVGDDDEDDDHGPEHEKKDEKDKKDKKNKKHKDNDEYSKSHDDDHDDEDDDDD